MNLIQINNGVVTTTSIAVAKHFGKSHKNIMRDVKKLHIPVGFAQLNFELISRKDSLGRQKPAYRMSRDGVMLLCMGYTGTNAMALKIAFIAAFNAMEKQLLVKAPSNALQRSHQRLLAINPLWRDIVSLKLDGYNHRRIAFFVHRHVDTVRRNVRAIEACGLLAEPKHLSKMQHAALHLHRHVSVGQ